MKRFVRNSLSCVCGVLAAAITVLVFLTAHVETKLMLKGQQQRVDAIEALLDSTDYGYVVMDQDGQIIEWNPALERLSRWTETEIKDRGLAAVMSPELLARHQRAFAAAFDRPLDQAKVSVVHCALPQRYGEGPPAPVQITVRIVQTRYGKRFAIAHVDPVNQLSSKPFLR